MQWPQLPTTNIYAILYILKFNEHALPVRTASRDQTDPPTHTHLHKFGRPPWPCGGNINKEIEESRHKWGPTLLSLTIHFPITKGDLGTKWSPSIFPLAQNKSRHQQQYSFSFRLSHTNKDAGRRWPPTWIWSSLSYWGKWKITHLNPVDSFQFHFRRSWIS